MIHHPIIIIKLFGNAEFCYKIAFWQLGIYPFPSKFYDTFKISWYYKYLQHCKYLWYCKYFSLIQFEDLFIGWLIWNVYAPKRLKNINSASHKISHRIWWITKLGHEFVTKWSDKLGDLFVTKFLNKFFTKFFTQFSELHRYASK